jgi:hypothetical protein
MKRNVILWLAAAGFGLAVHSSAQTGPNPNAPGTSSDIFVSDASQRTYTVTGTVVRLGKGQMVVRIDDHGHQIPFQVAPGADRDVRAGSHVLVTYHPTGTTGQMANQVQVVEAPRGTRR